MAYGYHLSRWYLSEENKEVLMKKKWVRPIISALTVAGIISGTMVPVSAEEQLDDETIQMLKSDGLSDEEIAKFAAYVTQESEFEKTTVTEPNVVSDAHDSDAEAAKLPDSAITDPAGLNKRADDGTNNRINLEQDDSASDTRMQTLNPTETQDNRIGALYVKIGPAASVNCTANHIGGKWWITAQHCVDDDLDMIGFIEQADGDFAGIEAIYQKSTDYDIALIKVGSGINSGTFDLSDTKASVGQVLSLVGYGTVNDYSSKSTLEVIGDYPDVTYWNGNGTVKHHYYDLLHTTPVLPDKYMTAKGDSGSAVWTGNTLYGIHSGDNSSHGGTDACHANTAPHVSWIKDTMKRNNSSSIIEKYRAFRGGIAQKYPRYNGGTNIGSFGVGSSIGSS